MTSKRDNIFRQTPIQPGGFTFNSEVADVFADMIARSVPGYAQILQLLPTLVRCFGQTQGCYYDLGCSLGAGMLAMAEAGKTERNIIGVDTSSAMLEQARPAIDRYQQRYGANLELVHGDILDLELQPTALVLMNFTLQFIAPELRPALLRRINQATVAGGVLILSEKICFEDTATQQAMTDLHHQFKADQGYSELEISRKRDAIENVLIPETLNSHIERLRSAGYRVVTPWIQNLQFVSLLAIK